MKKKFKMLVALVLSLCCLSGSAYADAYGDWSSSTVNGIKYEYCSAIGKSSSDGAMIASTQAMVAVGTTAPTGYIGAYARLYEDNGVLCTSSDWKYSLEGAGGIVAVTSMSGIKGKAYYSHGSVKFYNGSGYATKSVFRSPSMNKNVMTPAQFGKYEVNKNNQTFGSGLGELIVGKEPDLIQAYAENGQLGYVKSTDLNKNDYETLDEVRREIAQNGLESVKTIPVYESDGITTIGYFKLTN